MSIITRPGSEVAYAGRWDPQERLAVEPLPADEAARRYVDRGSFVALFGRPDALLEYDGQSDGVTVWHFDDQGRRDGLFEFRIVDPALMMLLRMVEWRYRDGCPEFDRASPRCVTTFARSGPQVEVTGPESDGWRQLSTSHRPQGVPLFGEWAPLLRFVFDEPPIQDPYLDGEETADDRPTLPGFSGPGLGPGLEVAAMFGPSCRYDIGDGSEPEIVTVETRPAGVLQLPTGRLVAGDPALIGLRTVPFAGAVPPGRFPVTIAGFTWRNEFLVAGCRVTVRDEPATVWEEALLEGEEPSTAGTYHPIGVDTGRIALLDAAAVPGLAALRDDAWEDFLDRPAAEVTDPRTGTNVITFSSGWGDGGYPAWLGRNDRGDIVCFVVDTEVLCGEPQPG
jgi:hypothetical protein